MEEEAEVHATMLKGNLGIQLSMNLNKWNELVYQVNKCPKNDVFLRFPEILRWTNYNTFRGYHVHLYAFFPKTFHETAIFNCMIMEQCAVY